MIFCLCGAPRWMTASSMSAFEPDVLMHERVGHASLLGNLANRDAIRIPAREEVLGGVENASGGLIT